MTTNPNNDRDAAARRQAAALTKVRAAAEQARLDTMSAEPWSAVCSPDPITDNEGQPWGVVSAPSIVGKEIWGCRLAYDILDTGVGGGDVHAVLNRYFTACATVEHAFLVVSAALATIAKHVTPHLIADLERRGNYEARVQLVEGARNAWAVRVNTLNGGAG